MSICSGLTVTTTSTAKLEGTQKLSSLKALTVYISDDRLQMKIASLFKAAVCLPVNLREGGVEISSRT